MTNRRPSPNPRSNAKDAVAARTASIAQLLAAIAVAREQALRVEAIEHYRRCRAAGDTQSGASMWVEFWLDDLVTEFRCEGLDPRRILRVIEWWCCDVSLGGLDVKAVS